MKVCQVDLKEILLNIISIEVYVQANNADARKTSSFRYERTYIETKTERLWA